MTSTYALSSVRQQLKIKTTLNLNAVLSANKSELKSKALKLHEKVTLAKSLIITH
jgi:hypothetical protein